jgi:acyl carrier protein
MMYAAAYPHNHQTRPDSIAVYNKSGQVEQRNFLVLKTQEEIEKYVINLFKNYFRTVNKGSLTLNSTIYDCGLDILDSVELVVRIEDELGYVVPGEALPCFQSVKNFVNYIKQTEDFKREFNKHPIS